MCNYSFLLGVCSSNGAETHSNIWIWLFLHKSKVSLTNGFVHVGVRVAAAPCWDGGFCIISGFFLKLISPMCAEIVGNSRSHCSSGSADQREMVGTMAFFICCGKIFTGEIERLLCKKDARSLLLLTAFPFFRGRHSESLFSILPYSLCLSLWHYLHVLLYCVYKSPLWPTSSPPTR